MIFDKEELKHYSITCTFAIPREEWEASQTFRQIVLDRTRHQPEREKAFLDHTADCFAIYQLRDDAALQEICFASIHSLHTMGRAVERGNYELVYTAPLAIQDDVNAILDQLWSQFNEDHPADFQHRSMSVSDIIAVKRQGVVSYHYCDSIGFQQLPDFIQPENYLQNVELQLEENCNMLDGIINNTPQKPTVAELEAQVKAGQTISLVDLAEAAHRERERKSVVAQLKSRPAQRKKTAPQKGAEKER